MSWRESAARSQLRARSVELEFQLVATIEVGAGAALRRQRRQGVERRGAPSSARSRLHASKAFDGTADVLVTSELTERLI
jgi:hypothetical protein